MGGSGSGRRWHWNTKDTTGSYRCLKIQHITHDARRQGKRLTPGATASVRWETPGGEAVIGTLMFNWTDCYYGGQRPWFCCPNERCRRRAAVLYLTRDGLLCRLCLHLAYPSQREDRAGRLLTKAQKIRMRLGGSGNMFQRFPPRPKGMHRNTYRRLRLLSERAWSASLGAIGERFSIGNEPIHEQR